MTSSTAAAERLCIMQESVAYTSGTKGQRAAGTLRSNGEINARSRVEGLEANYAIESKHLATSDKTRPSSKQPQHEFRYKMFCSVLLVLVHTISRLSAPFYLTRSSERMRSV